MAEVKRKLAAILSADVVGYGQLMQDDEAATVATLQEYRTAIGRVIDRHGGRVVNAPGDNILAEFPSAVEAVQGACEIQQVLKGRNLELRPERRMEFRIGVNLGEVIEEDDGTIYGDGVNIAARMEALAETGGVSVSGKVHDEVGGKLALRFDFLGEHEVKNVARPVPIYRVVPEDALASPAPTRKASAGGWRARAIAAVVVLVAAAAIVVFGVARWADETEPERASVAERGKPSIAVLPFSNMSDDPEQEYFADGITEDIITELSRFDGLLVIARNSTFRFKGRAVDIGEVSRALGVRYVLEGGVRRADDRVRITAQLIDATTGGHLWAERYDRELTDVFVVQDDVTRQIIAALRSELGEATATRSNRPLTTSHEAYDLFLRARVETERRTEHANVRAQDLFRQAIALDPAFAAAYAELSDAQYLAWFYGWNESATAMADALSSAEKAVALDRSSPVAHAQLGRRLVWFGRIEEAIAAANQAIALDANYAKGYAALALLYVYNGDYALALATADKASQLDPYAFRPTLYRGMVYFAQESYERAIDELTKGLELNPDFGVGYQWLAAAYALLGRDAEARAAAAEVMRLSPNFAGSQSRSPFKDRIVLVRLFDGLRKAGLDIPDAPLPTE